MQKDITKPNDEIKSVVKQFSKDKFKAVIEVMLWMRKNFSLERYDKALFRKSDAIELFKSKKLRGCSDVAILYISFMRALDIKATFIQTISKETLKQYLKNSEERIPITGHTFVRVNIDDISILVDPTYSQIYLKNKLPLDTMVNDAVIVGEGKDYVEIGMESIEKLREVIREYNKKNVLD